MKIVGESLVKFAVDPMSEQDARDLATACEQLHRKLNKIVARRVRKTKNNPKKFMIELTAQFLVARSLAENLVTEVVTEENEVFLRLVIDKQSEMSEQREREGTDK